MKNFRDFFNITCQSYKDLRAFIYEWDEGEQVVTYQQFYNDLISTANTLFGICNQKNVILMGHNSYDYILIIAACLCGAGKLFLADGDESEESLISFFKTTDACVLLYDDYYETKVKELLNTRDSIKTYRIEYCRNSETSCDTFQFPDYSFDEMRVVFPTSGTTQGNKKRVMLSGRVVLNNMLAVHKASLHEICGEKHMQLLILPLFHTLAFSCALLHTIYVGDATYISLNPNSIEKKLASVQPHYIFAVPSILEYLFRRYTEKLTRKRISGIKDYFGENMFCFLCGGAKINPEIVKQYINIGIRVIRGYGMSETGPVIAVTNLDSESVDDNNLGKPICHELKIVNQEICIRGENLMLGYYGASELTKESYEEGWFHTGDLGYINEKGLLYITGRVKDVIVLASGKKVIPEELEESLIRIPKVLECAVYSPDDISIYAYIYSDCIKGFSQDILNEVNRWNQKAPFYKKIRKVVLGDTPIPKTATNKIIRQRVPEHARINEICNEVRQIMLTQMYYDIFIRAEDDLLETFDFDSLEMNSFIIEIEDKFGCKIDIDVYLQLRTIWEISNYIYKQV